MTVTTTVTHNPDLFVHIRIIIGIITGLSVARLLNGLAGFVQHPKRENFYPVHFGWVLFLLLSVVHFWWFEITLSGVTRWTFELYFFIIFYASFYFFVCAILFPTDMSEYSDFKEYFHSRQKWFYSMLACLLLTDIADSAVKGREHFEALGPLYPVRQLGTAVLAIAAIWIRDHKFHIAFVVLALIAQTLWVVRHFNVFG